jgi:small-conductance mechanosensitive channel
MKDFLETSVIHYRNILITVFDLIEIGITVIIAYLLLIGLKKFLKYESKKRNLAFGDVYAIYQIIKYFLIIIVIIMILDSIGISTTVLLTSSAALLVGVGLGLQNIFKDFMSGILLLFSKIIRIDDIVQVGDMLGKVTKINLRTTKIITRDDLNILVPNSKFVEENVTNWTLDFKHIRQKLEIGVAYGSDVNLIKKLLLEIAEKNKDVLTSPKPFVRFTDFADSSLNFQLIFWTNNIFGMENVKSELRFAIDKAFRDNNITIPFPQRTIWINKEKSDEKND